jgi:hypothetical protein
MYLEDEEALKNLSKRAEAARTAERALEISLQNWEQKRPQNRALRILQNLAIAGGQLALGIDTFGFPKGTIDAQAEIRKEAMLLEEMVRLSKED